MAEETKLSIDSNSSGSNDSSGGGNDGSNIDGGRRLFLCITVPDELAHWISTLERPNFTADKNESSESGESSKSNSGKIRWQRKEKLHLTVEFIGHLQDEKKSSSSPPSSMTELMKKLRETIQSIPSFELVANQVVACQTRTLRLLFKDAQNSFVRLREIVRQVLLNTSNSSSETGEISEINEDKDERTSVSGHLTLARLKDISAYEIANYIVDVSATDGSSSVLSKWPPLKVTHLSLMASDKTGYHLVDSFPLFFPQS